MSTTTPIRPDDRSSPSLKLSTLHTVSKARRAQAPGVPATHQD